MQRRLWSLGFLLLAALVGPQLVLHVPPGQAPDETRHVLRADSLLHGELIGHRERRGSIPAEGVLADSALAEVVTLHPTKPATSPQAITPAQKWLATEVPWNDKPSFVEDGAAGGQVPPFYLPGALAIGLGHLAGFSPLFTFLAVRSFNLYCFMALGAAALYVARRGAVLIFATLLLPTTLSLAASGNPDGLLIATTACAAACLTRACDPVQRTYNGWLLTACCLLAAVAASKPAYAPLALLVFLPLQASAGYLARRLGLFVLTIMPACAWVFLQAHTANAASQIVQQGDANGFRYLPDWLYLAVYAGLACALAAHVCSAKARIAPSIPDFLLFSTAILLSVLISAMTVGGVQGGTILPLLPIVPLYLPQLNRPRLALAFAAPAILAALLSSATLPGLVNAFYPLR